MQFLKFFIVVLLAAACSADAGVEDLQKLIEPCSLEDSECLKRSSQNFLQKTHAGVPAYDIRPIDPISFNTLTFTLTVDKNIDHTYSNCTVMGYKDQRIEDYKINIAEKIVTLKSRADLMFDCHVMVYFNDEHLNIVVGPEHLTATVNLAATFAYAKKTVDGVEHFDIKEEEVCCYAAPDVKGTFTLEPGALEKFHEHPSIVPKKEYVLENADMYIGKCMCAVARHTFGTVVHNIRALARALPVTAFTNGT